MDWSQATPKPGRYEPDGRTPEEAMAAIRHAVVEIGYGYDAAGRLRFIQVGDEVGIAGFDPQDLAAISGGLFVHNHPPYDFPEGDPRRRAGSFSARDLVFMWEDDLTQIVAVTAERTYVLRRLPAGFYLDPGQIREDYSTELDKVQARLVDAAAAGQITSEEAMSQGRWADEVMDALGMLYDYRWMEDVP
jgi:hypothetical protein